jgi:hypothetical protein
MTDAGLYGIKEPVTEEIVEHIDEVPDEQEGASKSIVDLPEPTELIDQLGPEEARRLINEAIDSFASASRQESWNRRRYRILHLTNALERNLDYDIERFCAPIPA